MIKSDALKVQNYRIQFFWFFVLIIQGFLFAQTDLAKDSLVIEPTSVGSSEIAVYGQNTRNLINDFEQLSQNISRLKDMRNDILADDSLVQQKTKVLTDTLNSFDIDKLDAIANQMGYIRNKVIPLVNETEKWRIATDSYKKDFEFYGNSWQLTLDSLNGIEKKTNWRLEVDSSKYIIFNRYKKEVTLNLTELDYAEQEFEIWEAELFKTENALAIISDGLNEVFSIVAKKRDALISNIWTPEYAPIWKMEGHPFKADAYSEFKVQFKLYWESITNYVKGNSQFMYGLIFWFMVIYCLILYLKNKSDYVKSRLSSLDEHEHVVLKYPLIISYIIILFRVILLRDVPSQFNYFVLFVSILPFCVLIWELNDSKKIQRVLLFSIISLLLVNLSFIGLSSNLLRLILIVTNIFVMYLIYRSIKDDSLQLIEQKFWFGTLKSLMVVFFFINGLAIVVNAIGSVQLALILTRASLGTVVAFIIVRECVLVIQAFIHLLLLGPVFKKSYILQQDSELVITQLNKFLRIIGYITWIYITLDLLKIRKSLFDGFINYINNPLQVGELSISIGNILAFYVIIQLAVWLSSLIQYILKKEIFPRTKIASGPASTFSLLTKYTITFLGFLFALAGAGIELSKVALGVSALGIGIGFGLQNIINNFVSGIILAVERPFKIGDIVMVDDVEGIVVDIGLRASQIRKWNGSNVLVPNGSLISGKLTNWTYDDDSLRRLEIDIKLPVNTDAKKALDLIVETAKTVNDILKEPGPFTNHEGVKDGVIVLKLYAWISSYKNGLEIGTALKIAVLEALAKEGFEITIPKLDVRLNKDEKTGDT